MRFHLAKWPSRLSPLQSIVHQEKARSISTVARGTAYEQTVAKSLRRLGFSLARVGRANDCGIDLVGYWTLPSLSSQDESSRPVQGRDEHLVRIPTFVQCKFSRQAGPSHIREAEGAFPSLGAALAVAKAEHPPFSGNYESMAASVTNAGIENTSEATGSDLHGPELQAEAHLNPAGAIGIVATTRSATKGIREALARSNMPLAFLQVAPNASEGISRSSDSEDEFRIGNEAESACTGDGLDTSGGHILQLVWNRRATMSNVGGGALGRCQVTMRFFEGDGGIPVHEASVGFGSEVVLTAGGQSWEPLRGTDGEAS